MKFLWQIALTLSLVCGAHQAVYGQSVGDRVSVSSVDSMHSFKNVRLVFTKSKVGLSSKSGRWILPPTLDSASPMLPAVAFKKTKAIVWLVYTDSGTYLLHLANGFAPMRVSSAKSLNAHVVAYTLPSTGPLIGVVSFPANKILAPSFTELQYDSVLVGFVTSAWRINQRLKGILSKKGMELVPSNYTTLKHILPTRVVAVRSDGTQQLYDIAQGIPVGPSTLDSIGKFMDGFALVKQHHSFGLMDSMGIMRMPTIYRSIYIASKGRVLATKHPEWVTSQGDTLVAPFVYPLGSGLFSVPSKNGSLLVSAQHDTLAFVQSFLGTFRHSLCRASAESGTGLLDRTGKWSVTPLYTSVKPLFDTWWLAEDAIGLFYVYDSSGVALLDKPAERYKVDQLSRIWVNQNGLFRLLHPISKKLVGPPCDSIGLVTSMYTTVFINGKAGFVDSIGEWLSGPVWPVDAQLLGTDEVIYRHGKGCVIQYTDGSAIIHPFATNPRVVARMIEFEHKGHKGLMDVCGEIQFPAQAMQVTYDQDEDAWVAMHDTAMGALSSTGCSIVAYSKLFDSLVKYADPYSVVIKNGKAGMIDGIGRLRIANRFEALKPFQNGMAAYRLYGKWGFLNMDESLVIQPRYDSVAHFEGAFAKVFLNGKAMLYNTKGIVAADTTYTDMVYSYGWFLLEKQGKWGALHSVTEQRIPWIYDAIEPVNPQKAIVRKGQLFGLLNAEGRLLFEPFYTSVVLNSNHTDWVASLPEQEFSLTFKHR